MGAEPQSTRAWKQGAQGELRAGRALARHLRGYGVVLLHDRRIPGRGRANIDHLAIGPGAVTVIDTKSVRGGLRVQKVGGVFSARRELLLINGFDRTGLLDGLERQVARVRGTLGDLALDELICGALCYPDIDGLPLRGVLSVRGGSLAIGAPRGVARLARRRGPLSGPEVQVIAELLERRFPPA